MNIGILALQGNYSQHKNIMDILGIQNILIRYANQLDKCDALIIPGGESTTMTKHIDNNNLRSHLKLFAKSNPIMGTCAGMIMLSNTISNKNMRPLKVMDFQIERNAWGRQIDSFSGNIDLTFENNQSLRGVFIRAPKICNIGNKIQVLGTYNSEPVLLTNGMHIVSSFHPEIGNDLRIHKYFINQVNETISTFN